MRARLVFLVSFLPLAAGAASGVDTKAMSSAADPCVDFYQYACGNWIAQNPLPPDRSRWGRFTELSDHTEKVLLDMVETAASSKAPRGSLDQKIGDYFRSCMDTAAIEKKGIAPVRPELDRIQAMRDRADLAAEVARLHRQGLNVLFRFTSEPDPKDSAHMIAGLTQGGLSLPDRDYYLKTDAKSLETRQRFEQHVTKMFQLADEAPDAASKHARAVLELETLLAQPALDRVSRRDPSKTYHPMPIADLAAFAPAFAWEGYFHGVGASSGRTM
jgi:predicted metalloendopeptidase